MTQTFDQHSVSQDRTTEMRKVRLSMIGCGAMAESIIAGLLKQNLLNPAQILGSHPRVGRREELQAKYGVEMFADNKAAAQPLRDELHLGDGSIVMLAVKPQRLGRVLADLSGALHQEQLVVSIVAGASIETLTGELKHAAIVRAMPNTPAQIGQGMTVWTGTRHVNETQRRLIRKLLGSLGREMHVDTERMIDMATALSATGPTYVFLVMEALIDAGVHMGFSRQVAEELVMQTMLGSVLFAQESHKHPAELRNMVTSPGGTSAAAIYQMEKGSLRTVLSKAVWAAYQRAIALGEK